MLHIEVKPEIEQRFAEAAHARGLRPEDYAGELISAAAFATAPAHNPPSITADELIEGFLQLARTATPVKEYPEDFFSRDIIYADHD